MVIVVVLVWVLLCEVVNCLILGVFDIFDYVIFQVVFGMIFIVVIVFEFKCFFFVVIECSFGIF